MNENKINEILDILIDAIDRMEWGMTSELIVQIPADGLQQETVDTLYKAFEWV